MNPAKVDEVAKVAGRFMLLALAAVKRLETDGLTQLTGCKETGALRRASMDLTRALAELRRDGRS
jgi:hypothetical protein